MEALKDSESQIYQSLCLFLGVKETEEMTFGEIPAVDVQKLDEIELEKDMEKAVNNSSEMIDLRKANAKGSTSGVNEKTGRVHWRKRYESMYSSCTGRLCRADRLMKQKKSEFPVWSAIG